MADKKKVLFAAFEASPFIKTGGLGDVAGALPAHLKNDEYDARVILIILEMCRKGACDISQAACLYERRCFERRE